MTVDIIVPVLDAFDKVQRCLTTLEQYTPASLYTLYIADDGSSEQAVRELERNLAARGVQVHMNNPRRGFAGNCNIGAKLGLGDILVFLNSDTAATAGWLQAILKEFAGHPKTAVVGARLLYPEDRYGCKRGTVQHAGVVRNRDGLPYHIFRGFPAEHPKVMRRLEINAVTGAVFAIRREVFEQLGGFDEGYRNGFEDIDLCWQVRRAGYDVVYRPDCLLYHYEHGSGERYMLPHEAANRRRLLTKWGAQPADDNLFAARMGTAIEPDAGQGIKPLPIEEVQSLELDVLDCLNDAEEAFTALDAVTLTQAQDFYRAIREAKRVVLEHNVRVT